MSENLVKTEVKADGTNELVYVHYSLVHIEEVTNCTTQARPLLNEIQLSFQELKKQSENAYNKHLTLSVENQTKAVSIQTLEENVSALKTSLNQADSRIQELDQQIESSNEAAETLNDNAQEILKLKGLVSETTDKLKQATDHFKIQLKEAHDEMESAKLAEAEIREAIKKLKSEQEEIELLASKATLKLKEANTQLQYLQASSLTATGSIKELSRVDKLNSALGEAMNSSSKPEPKSSNSTVITLEDEDEEQQVSFNSQKFRIKMDSTLTKFRGRPD